MSDRLSALDGSFLYLDQPGTVAHVGSVAIFQSPTTGFDHQQVVALVAARIAYLPRYRQRVRPVPGRLAHPVWVDDERFDLNYHLRRSALPSPGSRQQLADLVARIQSRPLDRGRPLWELYLVEGLADGQFALVTKVHPALVDGIHAVDIAQVILDESPALSPAPEDTWVPAAEPSDFELVLGAVSEAIRSPQQAVDAVRASTQDLAATVGRLRDQAQSLVGVIARTATRPATTGPLAAGPGQERRYAMVATDLADHRMIRGQQNRSGRTEVTITDVVLTVLTGALRGWLLSRGEPVGPSTMVRALVPVSVAPDSSGEVVGATRVGSQVAAFLVDLPVGETNPTIRLHQVAYAMRSQADSGRAIRAQTLLNIAGFAPTTLHVAGARVASAASRRLTNVTITNVPGPQRPMYAAGAKLIATYPVMPIAPGQAVSLGATSYHGAMYYGLNADFDAITDLDVLAQGVKEALAELLAAAG